MAPDAPCRLTVFLARDTPIAVILRRGPSAWSRLSLWHTDTDTFEHGQWFHGRVYERRCDVSADGSLFVYFARQDRPAETRDLDADSWIAVSRPPWLTALAVWAIGGTYALGGYFQAPRSLHLGGIVDPPDKGELPLWLRLSAATPPFVDPSGDWTENTVYFNRLLRDGWTPVQDPKQPRAWWEHVSPSGHAALIMMPQAADFTSYGGRHAADYAVRSESDGMVHNLGGATWADWDQRGRLVVARDGRLFSWDGVGKPVELADFNPQQPDPQPPPVGATKPPDAPT